MSSTSRPEHGADFVPTEELIRRQGVKPLPPLGQLPWEDPFSSDEEYAEFLEDLYESRRRS
ncbi:hypothetical protein [Actinomycetospora termitidis]|uniref:Uncharacterized protein n=1 Tax=Actinomycetospora termitidis TaxID=3053470 RepID=A0ABT7M6Z1_9PSEU|nr:hypothetical protein [Actinomycetospora sp. Odt1-22]MDL5156435.1 hypothetical protein [Actinomycetospora sp. Odt1-22]